MQHPGGACDLVICYSATNNHITILISNSTWGIRCKINCLFSLVYWRPFCMEDLFVFRYTLTRLSKVENSVFTPLYLCTWIKYSSIGILKFIDTTFQHRIGTFQLQSMNPPQKSSHVTLLLIRIKTGLS